MKLFEDDWGEDNSPIEDCDITQVIFYFSKPDANLFKKLCKIGIKDKFPDYINDGNISEFLLMLLKEKYGNVQVEKMPDPGPVGVVESDVLG